MKYQVIMNNNYMNSFENYTKACELRDNLQKKFKNAKIDIVAI